MPDKPNPLVFVHGSLDKGRVLCSGQHLERQVFPSDRTLPSVLLTWGSPNDATLVGHAPQG
jgi:hypothetical protein